MTIGEIRFKKVVTQIHNVGAVAHPLEINMRLGRGLQYNLNGRESKWRREMFEGWGYFKRRGRWVRP